MDRQLAEHAAATTGAHRRVVLTVERQDARLAPCGGRVNHRADLLAQATPDAAIRVHPGMGEAAGVRLETDGAVRASRATCLTVRAVLHVAQVGQPAQCCRFFHVYTILYHKYFP